MCHGPWVMPHAQRSMPCACSKSATHAQLHPLLHAVKSDCPLSHTSFPIPPDKLISTTQLGCMPIKRVWCVADLRF